MASNTSNRGKSERSVQSAKGSKNGKRVSSKKRKARQKRRIILFAVELVALVALVGAFVAMSTIGKMEKVHINKEDIVFNEKVEENQEMKGYRNIALFAVDSRKGKLGKGQRTDTIMIASINQDTGEVKLCSIYRDTYLNLGNDKYNKANAAYAQGGPEQALNMLNWNFDMNITEYITVGFDALIEVIDALGGVEIDVAENEINDLNNYQRSMFVEDENEIGRAHV